MGPGSAGELRPTFWGANFQRVLDDFRSDADIPSLTAAILYEDMAPWSGAVGVADLPAPYRLTVHCGIEWLGYVNEIGWRTDVPADVQDFVPPEWEPAVRGESIDLSILLQTDPEPMIEATANGHTVVYRATAKDLPGCD